jgi:hypothetical protein
MAIGRFLKSCPINTSYTHLQAITLHKIDVDRLMYLLTHFVVLPCLYSLVITISGRLKNENAIYQLIFRLPVLQNGKFLFATYDEDRPLTIEFREEQPFSSMKHLVINGRHNGDQIGALLSYMPQLRRLSCHVVNGFFCEEIEQPSNVTHLSIKCWETSFEYFELFIRNYFPRLQVLRITMHVRHLNADRLEQLIRHHMPHLHTFDFQNDVIIRGTLDTYVAMFDRFNSKFWRERQWNFVHEHFSNCRGTTIRSSTQSST